MQRISIALSALISRE